MKKILFGMNRNADKTIENKILSYYKSMTNEEFEYDCEYYLDGLKEALKSTHYDVLILREDLEENIKTINISYIDEITDNYPDLNLIYIIDDEHYKDDYAKQLFAAQVKNIIYKKDLELSEICSLIDTVRSKADTKIYLGIDEIDNLTLSDLAQEIPPEQIENILTYFLNVSSDEELNDLYNEVSRQYTDKQMIYLLSTIPENIIEKLKMMPNSKFLIHYKQWKKFKENFKESFDKLNGITPKKQVKINLPSINIDKFIKKFSFNKKVKDEQEDNLYEKNTEYITNEISKTIPSKKSTSFNQEINPISEQYVEDKNYITESQDGITDKDIDTDIDNVNSIEYKNENDILVVTPTKNVSMYIEDDNNSESIILTNISKENNEEIIQITKNLENISPNNVTDVTQQEKQDNIVTFPMKNESSEKVLFVEDDYEENKKTSFSVGILSGQKFYDDIRQSCVFSNAKIEFECTNKILAEEFFKEIKKHDIQKVIIDIFLIKNQDNFLKEIREYKKEMNDVQIIVIAFNRTKGDSLLSQLVSLAIYDIIAPNKNFITIVSDVSNAMIHPATYKDASYWHIDMVGGIDIDALANKKNVAATNTKKEIIEVEKIVEKEVEKIIQVPVEKIVEKVVEVEKVIEVPKIVEKPIHIYQTVHNDKMLGTTVISVSGITRGMGCTHLSLALGMFLKNKKYKVAINSLGENTDIEQISSQNDLKIKNNKYTYKNIDVYWNTNVSNLMNLNYDFIIIDIGSLKERENKIEILDEINRSFLKIILCGASNWRIFDLSNFVSNEDNNQKWIYAFNYVPNNKIKYIKNLMDTDKLIHYFLPIFDWEKYSGEAEGILLNILSPVLGQQAKIKKKFFK